VTQSLFRAEAVQAKYGQQFGHRGIAPVVGRSLASVTIVATAITVVLFLCYGYYTPRDTVRGHVIAKSGGVRVFSSSDGVVESVLVVDGQIVEDGQHLLTLATARAARREQSAGEEIVASLQSELDALHTNAQLLSDQLEIRITQLENRLANLYLRRPLIAQQLVTAETTLSLANAELDRLTDPAVSPYISATRKDAATRGSLEQEQGLTQLMLLQNDLFDRISTTDLSIDDAKLQRRSDHATYVAEKARLQRKLTEAASQISQIIVASSSGRITGLDVRRGQTVSSRVPLLSIAPINAVLAAELLVPGTSIAFVEQGAKVSMRMDSFPFQTHGMRRGRVESISSMAVLPAERRTPVRMTEPYYVVRVNLEEAREWDQPPDLPLHVGMRLSADILRRRQRLLFWLLDPLSKAMPRI
jgi:membrane fusion protein